MVISNKLVGFVNKQNWQAPPLEDNTNNWLPPVKRFWVYKTITTYHNDIRIAKLQNSPKS